jgi:hypothetical protein
VSKALRKLRSKLENVEPTRELSAQDELMGAIRGLSGMVGVGQSLETLDYEQLRPRCAAPTAMIDWRLS